MSLPLRRIGSLEVTTVGIGCNNFGGRIDERAARRVVDAALDQGVNFFDTADIYGGTLSEEFLGRALGGRRDRATVATKFGMEVDKQRRGAAPDYVHRALDDSLRRLGTNHVDLYQMHAPDPSVPIGDTLAALDEEVRAGRVREIGCSNFSTAQLEEASRAVVEGAARFVSVQNEYSVLHRAPEAKVLPWCAEHGAAFIPYFPLARGLLTGKYRAGQKAPAGTRLARVAAEDYERWASPHNMATVQALSDLAAAHGRPVVELAIAWLLAQGPVASVIAGATSADQVAANAAAADWALDAEILSAVDAVVGPATDLL